MPSFFKTPTGTVGTITVGVGSAAAAAIWRAGGTVEQYSAGLLTLTLTTGLGK